MESLQCKRFRI